MGVYNPYNPTILGQEWAPIREEDILLSPAVNAVEMGHSFSTAVSYNLFEGRFYINQLPAGRAVGQVYEMAVYPKGTEDQSGPIKRVLIPTSGASITGSGVSLVNASTTDEALFSPSDNKYVQFLTNSGASRLGMFFNTDNPSYAALLNGKRILGVNLIYSATGSMATITSTLNLGEANLYIENDIGRQVDFGPLYGGEGVSFALNKTFSVARFGEIDHFWSPTFSPYSTSDRMPHNYASLLRMAASGGANRTRIMYRLNFSTPSLIVYINYAALEVLYCEEQRYAVGARAFGYVSGFPLQYEQYVPGTNIIPMRHVGDNAASPALGAGSYTVTIASADIGDVQRLNTGVPTSTSPYPELNGLRQLYSIPSHPGIQIDHPFPVDESIVDSVFTVKESDVLPQLSLNVVGGAPLNEVHVYGRQAAAQVYGSVTATQELYDVPAVSGTSSYPQVRFYARRFGDTVVPLTLSSPIVTGVGSTVSISPNAFDALPPEDGIIDGWKEVTLRFTVPPVMGAGTKPQWTWSATSELPGNRWEVLGAIAPALSGVPGNSLNVVPASQSLAVATYGQPVSGAGINLGWVPGYAPYVSGTTDDPTADATLLFSQDPPAVSGLTWTMLTQPISGIGLDCAGSAPCCVPTGIRYNRLTWTGAPQYCDTFSSPAATGGWGTSSCGDAWSTSGTGIPSDYSVTGTEGAHRIRAAGTELNSFLGSASNVDMTFQVRVPQLSTGTGSQFAGALLRYQSTTSFINYRLVFDAPSQLVTAQINIPGVNSATQSTNITHAVSNIYMVRVQALGPNLKMKVWLSTGTEPDDWTTELVDSTLSVGAVGFKSGTTVGITTTMPVSMFYDNFVAIRLAFGFNSYELQRSDSLTDWQTIMISTNAAQSSFNDYEARVGITSSYRIRGLNTYNFASLWSPTVTGMIASPGVTGGPCLNATGTLIFTSNASQTGMYNLAYVQIFENDPEENFVFPEADTLQLRRMFRRDYQVAFKPTERGGEAFSRLILVQAAAIAAPKLANIRSLRDMAWADLPYVCVRDEVGDRWFASVVVPGDRVLRNRRLYFATIGIVEVTATSSVVNP